jgi:murein DD-endopeptidase MepM/ murein hydrolase activator NlpD
VGPAVRSRRPGAGRAFLFAVLLVALAPAGAARADTSVAPCVAAGLVAVIEPGAPAAVFVGPSVTASAETGTNVPSFQDAATEVDLRDAEVGAAGCVNGSAPGGTSARAGTWSILGGAVAGTGLQADLVPAAGDGSSWHLRAKLTALTVAGDPAQVMPGASIGVGDWGVLERRATFDGHDLQPLRWWAAALELKLTQAHAGLPVGTLVLIGYAAADRPPAPPPSAAAAPTSTTTTTTTATTATTGAVPRPARTTPAWHTANAARTAPAVTPRAYPRRAANTKRHRPRRHRHAKRHTGSRPLHATPPLGAGTYVFPVAGRTAWGDTYGVARPDASGGWHHGDDVFAPLGTPVVAVADGTVFSVGWNRIGGWRLWLVDANGNEFYYAHLSGYTVFGRNDRHVRHGEVLGFVGNTGDAVTTWPHLHFEVHPSSLLYLGYDGAVDPTSYLASWKRPGHLVVPPPVALPGQAPAGRGSAMDFRALLAVHPIRATAPSMHLRSVRPDGMRGLPPVARPLLAAGVTGRTAPAGDSSTPLVAAVLILLLGAAVLIYTARSGRASR